MLEVYTHNKKYYLSLKERQITKIKKKEKKEHNLKTTNPGIPEFHMAQWWVHSQIWTGRSLAGQPCYGYFLCSTSDFPTTRKSKRVKRLVFSQKTHSNQNIKFQKSTKQKNKKRKQ